MNFILILKAFFAHGNNDFAKISKNLDRYRSEILLDHQNNYVGNYVGNSYMKSNSAKSFDILATSLSVLYKRF